MFSCRCLSDPEASSSKPSTSCEEDNWGDTSCSIQNAKATEQVTGMFQMSDFTNLITLLLKSNRVLHQEIQKMQRDHKKTMTILMQVCHKLSKYKIPYSDSAVGFVYDGNSVVRECDGVGEVCERRREKMEESVGRDDKDDSTDHLPREDDDIEDFFHQKHQLDDVSVESSTSYSIESDKSSCNKEENNANPDHFESPGMEAVKKMWDKFSMNSCNLTNEEPVIKSKQRKRTSRVTVPQPFNMSIREANYPKKMSRSLKIAEQEVMKKKAIDDAEINKKFRATPIPASTFLPLHELSNAINEEKLKKRSVKKLELTQKPFSFYKRDVLKHKHREDILKQNQDQEVAVLKKNIFKAKPVPPNVFDPEIDQKLLEQEEYKATIKKVRADELLAKSKLPFRMHKTAARSDKKLECLEAKDFRTDEQCFHPKTTHNIPDFPRHSVSEKPKGTTTSEPDFVCSERNMQDKFQATEKITQRRIKQRRASQITLSMEPYLSREASRRRKMEEFRTNNKLNFWKFQQQLQHRDTEYPFLLEQDTQKPIRRSKEFYISALKDSGFGEDKIKNFLQNFHNDSQ